MIFKISHPSKILKGEITLPSSKSESNRILMIKAISGLDIDIQNLSPAKDTQTLVNILNDVKKETPGTTPTYDVGHAGTTMRFLTAYFSCIEGERILTGSERMLQRPIGELVTALRKLGADIEYLGNKGYPPIKINGDTIHGGEIEINGSISSQFISALLMVSPLLQRGLVLNFTEELISKPYVMMTLNMMEMYGVYGNWENNSIQINQQDYSLHVSKQYYSMEEGETNKYMVEGDWSSASYLFSLVALAKEADVVIRGLKEKSLQGDAVVKSLFEFFAVHSVWEGEILHLRKAPKHTRQFHYNFEDCPDIAQTMAVVAGALKIPSILTGLKTLRVKETDRIDALKNELAKLNVGVEVLGDEGIKISPMEFNNTVSAPIATYHDHRMALSFAPLALVCDAIEIEHPDVIEKSYPSFWNDLKGLGFVIS